MNREEKIENIISLANNLIGAPYKYGAYSDNFNDDQKEFDCSSFIQFIFKKNGIDLPRSSILQAAAEGEKIAKDALEPGDVVFFEGERGHYRHDLFPGEKIYIGHVGIYSGNDEFIHAVNSGGHSGVKKQKICPTEHPLYNKETIVLAKRFI